MARVRVTVEGWGRLKRRLNELPEDVRRGALDAVEEGARAVQSETRERVRVRTGALRNGVKVRVNERWLRADVGWSDPELYYAKYQEFGTSKITANPALTTAGEAERRRFPGRVSEEVRKEIER